MPSCREPGLPSGGVCSRRGATSADAMRRPPGPPMDLANMRKNGVRCLIVHCLACAHQGSVKVGGQPGALAVVSFESG